MTRTGTGTNQEAVRRHNLGTVLRHVHRTRSTSRASLTTQMALNRSTIGGLAATLEELGVVRRSTPVSSRAGAGRPSAGLEVVSRRAYVLAIDVGVDRVVVGRVGLGCDVEVKARVNLPPEPAPEHVADTIVGLVAAVRADASPESTLVGVGISVPGVVREADGMVVFAPNLGWHEVPFAAIVREKLDLDVDHVIANDADLGARAEHVRGAGVDVDHLIYVSGDVGVGAGVITAGRPLGGAGGFAGELGHMSYDPQGLRCHCGSRGCWETQVGAVAIARAIGAPTDVVATLDTVLDDFDGPLESLHEIARHVGHGLANVVNLLNPQVVVLGGYLASLHRLVEPEILAAVRAGVMSGPGSQLRVTRPALGGDAVLVGAAEAAFESLLADPVGMLGVPAGAVAR
ncbi:ROK family protein [Aeromicrobium sp. Leaf350]|uniref:ROK family protein n=1 Tax=Aeromicrobium sp. Leaf350 TaxID=2876565 RepID=UPI001E51AD1E|nr:ROK family protein [Aeromicrobium sp. Leaf350]